MRDLFEIMMQLADLAAHAPEAIRSELLNQLHQAKVQGDDETARDLQMILESLSTDLQTTSSQKRDAEQAELEEEEDERDLQMIESLIERVETGAGSSLRPSDLLVRLGELRPGSQRDAELLRWIEDFKRRCS